MVDKTEQHDWGQDELDKDEYSYLTNSGSPAWKRTSALRHRLSKLASRDREVVSSLPIFLSETKLRRNLFCNIHTTHERKREQKNHARDTAHFNTDTLKLGHVDESFWISLKLVRWHTACDWRAQYKRRLPIGSWDVNNSAIKVKIGGKQVEKSSFILSIITYLYII